MDTRLTCAVFLAACAFACASSESRVAASNSVLRQQADTADQEPFLGGAACDIDVRPFSDNARIAISFEKKTGAIPVVLVHVGPGAGHGASLRTLKLGDKDGEEANLNFDLLASRTNWLYRPYTLRFGFDEAAKVAHLKAYTRVRGNRTHIADGSLPLLDDTRPAGEMPLTLIVDDPRGAPIHHARIWLDDDTVVRFTFLESE